MKHQTEQEPGAMHTDTALGSAFQENAAKIYAFIYAKVGNRETAEDLTSQVFLKATRWLAEDRSADSIRSWLYTTARTCIVDHWREQGRSTHVSLDDPEALLFCGTDGVEEVRRTRDRALRVLSALPEREREVLRLRFLRGYSAAEIGTALGLSPGNVRVLQLRALRRAAQLAGGSVDPSGAIPDSSPGPITTQRRPKGGTEDER
jgi:RNA polymerase sigma-70 factor (ECF subfamily)